MGKDPKMIVRIEYVNYKGERKTYRVEPLHLWYGATPFHPDPQWLLKAYDHDRKVRRDFAMNDIKTWTPDGPAA